MPIGGVQDPQVDLDRLDAGAASLPTSQGQGLGAAFDLGAHDFSDKFLGWALHSPQFIPEGYDGSAETQPQHDPMISADEANRRYGVEGALRFNGPVADGDAAWQSAVKRRQLLDSTVLARSNANPLLTFGAGLAGSLTDPIGLSVMLSTDGLGEAGVGALGLRGAQEAGAAGAAVTRLGRLANAGRAVAEPLVQGAIDNAPYVAASGLLSNANGEDYSFGDGLRDIAAGAILHTTVHAALRGAGDVLGRFRSADGDPTGSPPATAFEPNPAPAEGVPPDVDALTPQARQGAFALAVDQMAGDEPVRVGDLVQQELQGMADSDADPSAPSLTAEDLMRMETAQTLRERKAAARAAAQEASDANNYQTLQRVQAVESDPRTAMLRSAADQLSTFATDKRIPRADDLPSLLNDDTLRNGQPISDSTEGFLRQFFRDPALTQLKPRNEVRDILAGELGRDIPREIQANLAQRFRTGDAGDIDIVRPPGPTRGGTEAPAMSLERDAGAEGRGAAREEGGGAPAAGQGGAVVLDKAALRERLTGAGDDLDALGKQVRAEVAQALKDGRPVTMYAEGKPRTIVAVDKLGMKDKNGNPWGIGPLLMQAADGKDRLEIGGAAKADKPKGAGGDALISADPELRALKEATEQLEAANGIKPEIPDNEDPNTLAEAVRAAAVCLAGEAE